MHLATYPSAIDWLNVDVIAELDGILPRLLKQPEHNHDCGAVCARQIKLRFMLVVKYTQSDIYYIGHRMAWYMAYNVSILTCGHPKCV